MQTGESRRTSFKCHCYYGSELPAFNLQFPGMFESFSLKEKIKRSCLDPKVSFGFQQGEHDYQCLGIFQPRSHFDNNGECSNGSDFKFNYLFYTLTDGGHDFWTGDDPSSVSS